MLRQEPVLAPDHALLAQHFAQRPIRLAPSNICRGVDAVQIRPCRQAMGRDEEKGSQRDGKPKLHRRIAHSCFRGTPAGRVSDDLGLDLAHALDEAFQHIPAHNCGHTLGRAGHDEVARHQLDEF